MGSVVARIIVVVAPNSNIANEPGLMALMGAVALLGGIQRSAISLCVIMLEGTGQIQYLLPIVFTTVVARYVGNHFGEGLYELAQHVKHFPFLEHDISREKNATRTVRGLMARPVQTVSDDMTLHDIVGMLEDCPHNGFPMTNANGQLMGMVLRTQLLAIVGYEHRREQRRIESGESPMAFRGLMGIDGSGGGQPSWASNSKKKKSGYGAHERNDQPTNRTRDHPTNRTQATMSFIDSMTVAGTEPSFVTDMRKSGAVSGDSGAQGASPTVAKTKSGDDNIVLLSHQPSKSAQLGGKGKGPANGASKSHVNRRVATGALDVDGSDEDRQDDNGSLLLSMGEGMALEGMALEGMAVPLLGTGGHASTMSHDRALSMDAMSHPGLVSHDVRFMMPASSLMRTESEAHDYPAGEGHR
jgi:CBS domain-containing protein